MTRELRLSFSFGLRSCSEYFCSWSMFFQFNMSAEVHWVRQFDSSFITWLVWLETNLPVTKVEFLLFIASPAMIK